MLNRLATGARHPLVRLPRQFITLLLLLASLLAALSLNVLGETRALLWPQSPTERYNRVLAELYLAASDWQIIHHIEREVNVSELTEAERAAFRDRLWSNYRQSPEEYQALGYLDVVRTALAEREGAFQAIVRDRSQYLADEAAVLDYPDQVSDRQRTTNLLALLEALQNDIQATRSTLGADGGPAEGGATRETINLTTLESYQRALANARELVARDIPYTSLTPRYEAIVYDSYQHVRNDTLVELSQTILLDRSEDAALRLMAADYLRQYGDRELLMEQLFQLLAEAKGSGVDVGEGVAGSTESGLFARGLLDVLRRTVLEQAGPPQP